ncbi:NADH-quinone oxidoreductase subunit NuoH [Carboxydochorda subterranea]|uniref:NADH-quinone oxidoreductase subunit H n=1 Tax=Carboxydichorda subterranea TaxID=3109565 RepID=A0ABZ1C1G9_9FIRM|nr:NADH-quinone oxidoreductase subunit NuoH [Limnochorda sp. L945t]WRP18927.1 NADH-quinone oxidoreductase subunit NuoH [Limnochorda sp. L945t]
MVAGVIAPPSQWYGLAEDYFVRSGWPLGLLAVAAALVKVLLVLAFVVLNVLFLIWLERKISAWIQNRLGPMRTGPFGLLQTMADALKLLVKEDVIPAGADRWVFVLAPIVTFVPALLIYVVVPFGERLVVQDLNIGVLFVAAMTSAIIPSFLMAGWSSNNKWSVFGALRSAAQLVSYEVPLVLAVVAVVMLTGSLSLVDIVEAQRRWGWFILLQPLGFLVYYTAALAEANRAPFDLIEAESELVAGFNTEYSGIRWAIFFLAEYANLLSGSAIAATLYLGGWNGPWLPPFVWFLIKTYFFVFLAMWIRWTVPRIRVDQLMNLGWKVLLPLSLVNLALTGVYVMVR